jgi:hypothetical protein
MKEKFKPPNPAIPLACKTKFEAYTHHLILLDIEKELVPF